MVKRRAVVTGWDPTHVNPDTSTGRPKGVQTAADMRVATTYDVLAEGIFASKGVPAVVGSPVNTLQITPFMAAILSPKGGYYIVSITANESVTLNLSNVGAVKIYVQQKDWEIANNLADADSEVVLGAVYGATAIPAGALLLFTTTISNQTSTNGLTFTPAFKYTGAASGQIRVPTQADLANVAVIQAGIKALVTTTGGGGTVGEYFYTGTAWQITTVGNPLIETLVASGWLATGQTFAFSSWNATTRRGVITVPSDATTKYKSDMRIRIVQATGGTKYGRIESVTSTTITVLMLSGSVLNNEAITSPNYSTVFAPQAPSTVNFEEEEPWIAPTFQNGWINYGSGFDSAAYMKDRNGFVHLKGMVKSGTANTTFFTLPAGYRSSATLYYPAVNAGTGMGIINIGPSGTVTMDAGNAGYMSISSVIYKAEA